MKDYDKSKYYVGAVVNVKETPYGITFVFNYNKLEKRGEYNEETWGEILYIGDDWSENLPKKEGVCYMPVKRRDFKNVRLGYEIEEIPKE